MPRFRKIFNDFGLTEQQGRVLRVLWDRDEIPLGELAELTLIATPSLVGIIDRLSAAGLVARNRSARDRRVVNITATDSGRALQADIMPQVASVYAALKQSVDAVSWEQTVQGLQQIAAAGDAGKHDG